MVGTCAASIRRFSFDVGMVIAEAMEQAVGQIAAESGKVALH